MPSAPRLAALAASLVAVAASVQPASAQTSPGWMYTTNMTIDSGGVGHKTSMAMKYQVTDRHLRMDFVQVSGMNAGASAEGMGFILDEADSTMTTIMGQQHMAMVMGLGGTLGGVMKAGASMAPKIEPHITRNIVDDLGPAEKILGHPTHHYRVTTAGSIDMTMMGRTCTQPVDAVAEMWLASDVDLMPAMQSMGKHFGAVLGVDMMDQMKGMAGSSSIPKGTALRTVSTSTMPGANGSSVPVTSTIEYVEMSQAPIPASAFAVPSDFQTMDMRKMMADMPAGMLDSAMAAGATTARESTTKSLCTNAAKP